MQNEVRKWVEEGKSYMTKNKRGEIISKVEQEQDEAPTLIDENTLRVFHGWYKITDGATTTEQSIDVFLIHERPRIDNNGTDSRNYTSLPENDIPRVEFQSSTQ